MAGGEVNVGLRPLPGGIVALDLRGFVDKQTVHVLDQSIARLVEQGRNNLVVNCKDLTYISSDGIGVFLSHLFKIRKAGGGIRFCCMHREARTVMDVLGLGKILPVHATEDEALREFQRQVREKEARAKAAEEEQNLSVKLRYIDPGVCVAALRGFIDRHTIVSLESSLKRALDDNHPKLVVNCDGLTYISSNGMGAFIGYLPKARGRGGDIRFCHMRDIARTVITMLGLQNIFKVYETEAEAIASYGS